MKDAEEFIEISNEKEKSIFNLYIFDIKVYAKIEIEELQVTIWYRWLEAIEMSYLLKALTKSI